MKLEKTVNGATFSVSIARGVFPNERRVKADIRLIRPGKIGSVGQIEFLFGPLPDNQVDRDPYTEALARLLGPRCTFGPLRWHIVGGTHGLMLCDRGGYDPFTYPGETAPEKAYRFFHPKYDWCQEVCDTFGLALKSHVSAECDPEDVRY